MIDTSHDNAAAKINTAPWRGHAIAGLLVIATAFLGFGGFAALAPLGSAVSATGRIAVENERQTVQHLEGGIVREILVAGDRRVDEGEVLVRLDPTQAQASREVARTAMATLVAEVKRLEAEITRASDLPVPLLVPELAERVGGATLESAFRDQRRAFSERALGRDNDRALLMERLRQSDRQVVGARAQLEAANAQIASFDAEIGRLQPLLGSGLVPRVRVDQVERARTDAQGRIGALEAEIGRLAAVEAETRRQIEGVERKFIEDASVRMAAARREMADANDKLRVAEDQIARLEIRAPKSGRIVNRRIHTVGAVVRAGETIMEIVPDQDTLIVAARLNPMDISHVHPGLVAEVKLPSLRQRNLPIALGEVKSVSADVSLDDVTRQPYYVLHVSVRASSFPSVIRDKLVPGMPADVLVATGERTLMNYLVQPLADAFRRGMREH